MKKTHDQMSEAEQRTVLTEISIQRSRKLDGTLGKPKNGKTRTVPLLPPARVLGDVPRRPDPFVFHSPVGKPLIKGTHGWSWQKVKAAARTPEVRWHDLRHFCATQLLELGLDHFAVSVQLGHTDGGALVMSRYGHPSEDAAHKRLLRAFEWNDAQTGSPAGSQSAAN
jgi:integrase